MQDSNMPLFMSQEHIDLMNQRSKESQELKKTINSKNLNAEIKTGADEIPLTLLSRCISNHYNEKITISPTFTTNGKDIISRYEDISIEKSTNSQIELCGAKATTNADIELIVNTPSRVQDDIALGIYNDPKANYKFTKPHKPYAIADIRLANGADNNLVNQILSQKIAIPHKARSRHPQE